MVGIDHYRVITTRWRGTLLASVFLSTLMGAVFPVTPVSASEGGMQESAYASAIPGATFRLEALSEHASMSMVQATGQDFKSADRVVVKAVTEAPWLIQYQALNEVPINIGDVLLATVYIRCHESMTGECYADAKFELAKPNWDSAMHIRVSAGSQWKRYDIPFKAPRDYKPGEGRLTLQLGHGKQQVDIGTIELRNYGPNMDIDRLPATELTYPGRDLDARWREAASERIDKLRKGNLVVHVTDAAGNAVKGAQVRVQMRRHAFGFGSAVVAGDIADQSNTTLDPYREKIAQLFNEVVFENDLKWVNHGFGDPRDIDSALSWLAARDIAVRGHVLVWPSWGYLPPDLRDLENDHGALRSRVVERVKSAVGTYRGRLHDWDVLNEPYNNHDLMDVLGDEVMVDWFMAAREADPDAKLFINDWGILTSGDVNSPHVKHYYKTIQYLIENGAPLDGIGMQGHFGAVLTPPTKLLEILDQFAAFGKTIKITELDMVIGDDKLRTDYMRDVMTVLFSHPSVESVVMWGFWSQRHWKPDAALYDSNWELRPHGQAWLDLVKTQWWTDELTLTDAQGRASIRGFKGSYKVTVETDQGIWSVDAANGDNNNTIEVICK